VQSNQGGRKQSETASVSLFGVSADKMETVQSSDTSEAQRILYMVTAVRAYSLTGFKHFKMCKFMANCFP
jgi:hypothetical protein